MRGKVSVFPFADVLLSAHVSLLAQFRSRRKTSWTTPKSKLEVCVYFGSCRKGTSAHYAFEASFNMDRSNPGKPSIAIRVSARRSDAQEHATMQAKAAQKAIDSGDLKPVDPESALENSFSKLSDTLGEVVKVIFEKMDILAEVGFYHKRVIVLCPDRLPYQQLHPYANIAWKACSSLYRVGPS